ncbi:MAG: hypothetical protein GY757_12135 [bacterium]|nr:hypothetical protein [bacterium]
MNQDINEDKTKIDGEIPEVPKKETAGKNVTPEVSANAGVDKPDQTGGDAPGKNGGAKNGKSVSEIVAEQEHQKPVFPIIIFALLVVILLVMGYFLFFKDKGAPGVDENIRQMQQTAQQIQDSETTVKKMQDETQALIDEYKQKKGDEAAGVKLMNLNPEEKALLEQKIKDEKDVSIKSLLEEINDKDSELKVLQQKITELEALLPKPHVVTEGENHYQVAMDFLLNVKKVEKDKAMKLVERTALIEPLVPGFKVWNFYSGDAYGTSVTQGTAPISPNTLIRRAKKKLVDARDQAISEKEKLAVDIQALEEKRNGLIKQLGSLNREKETLISQVTDLNKQNVKMQTTVNSLFYLLDMEKNLKKEGIIKGGFLKTTKLKKVSPEYFTTSVDLRSMDQVSFTADDLGIGKIKKITLFPKFYKKGVDYKVEFSADKKHGIVTFLSIGKFKNERVVISVK